MYHKRAIENCPLQTYASALVFSPARSLIRCLFKEEEPNWITIKPAIRDKWSSCLQTLEGHSSSVNSVAFSHDSTRLASSDDRTVKIWDTSSGECLQTLGIGKMLFNISIDTTNSFLHIDIGTIAINAPSASNVTPSVTGLVQNPRYQGWGLSSDGVWITYNSENLVWLPSEYRPLRSAVSRKTIGVGVGSGKVWICNFNVDDS